MRTASTRRSEGVSTTRGGRRGGRAVAGPATPKRPSVRAARLAALIAELENAVESLGIRVRRERLMREVGYHARSGLCRVGDEQILFVDHDLTPDDEIELLALTLSGHDLSAVEMSPETRRLLGRAAGADQVDKHQPRQ